MIDIMVLVGFYVIIAFSIAALTYSMWSEDKYHGDDEGAQFKARVFILSPVWPILILAIVGIILLGVFRVLLDICSALKDIAQDALGSSEKTVDKSRG